MQANFTSCLYAHNLTAKKGGGIALSGPSQVRVTLFQLKQVHDALQGKQLVGTVDGHCRPLVPQIYLPQIYLPSWHRRQTVNDCYMTCTVQHVVYTADFPHVSGDVTQACLAGLCVV
jgi:hypothetical protein